MKAKKIGIDAPAPKKECEDKKCPFHGNLKIRERTLVGEVIKSKVHQSIIIEIKSISYIPKYERYEKKRTRIHAHNPSCIDAKEGDIVKIAECRPLSKTKKFVVIQKLEEK